MGTSDAPLDEAAIDRRHAELLLEYEQLREEIRHNEALGFQVLGAATVLVGTLAAVAFSEAIQSPLASALLFLLANVVAAVAVGQRTALARQTRRAAAYMCVFVEAELTAARYETRLAAFRSRGREPRPRHPSIRWYLAHLRYGLRPRAAFTSSGRYFYYLTMAVSLATAAYFLLDWTDEVAWRWHADTVLAVLALLVTLGIDIGTMVAHADEYARFEPIDRQSGRSAFHVLWAEIREDERRATADGEPRPSALP